MNRTVQFFGQGYGKTPAKILVKLDNVEVYSGEVATIDQNSLNTAPTDQVMLFSCELPVDFGGLKPMEIEVLSGTVVFAHVWANYCFSDNENDFFDIRPGSDARKNVKINGTLQTPDQDLPGTWSWTVEAGETFTYDLDVVSMFDY